MAVKRFFDYSTYDYVKAQAIVVVDATWQNIATLVTPEREADVYEIGMALTYTFDLANESAMLRFRVNGSGWTTFIREPKDKTDAQALVYLYPKSHTGGTMTIEFEASKESSSGTFNIEYLDLWFKRLGTPT